MCLPSSSSSSSLFLLGYTCSLSMEEKGIYFAHSTIFFFFPADELLSGSWGKKNPSISASTLHCLCRFRCVRGCFGRLFRINCSFVPSFSKCAGIASCVQGAVFARAGGRSGITQCRKALCRRDAYSLYEAETGFPLQVCCETLG